MKKVRKIEVPEKDTVRKLRVAVYCRVSTNYESQKSSLELQKSHYQNFTSEQSDWILVGIYARNNKSDDVECRYYKRGVLCMGYQEVKVIVCDDDKNVRNQIYNYLEEFELCNQCKFDIKTFSSGEEMMKSSAIEECELLFLDIEMGALNGIELSHIFREQQGRDELQIIFVSAYDRYMREMFEVRPFNYLSKPFTKEKFNDTLEKFLRLHKKSSAIFTFKIGRELYRLPYKEILYFESSKRKIILHTKDDTMDFYGKLDELETELKENSFFRIHQSYLVNPVHIRTYSSHGVTLINGLEIPISPKYKKAFLQMQIIQ